MGGDRDLEAELRWTRNWHRMSAAFGVTSGVNVLIIAYSTSILGENNNLGFIGPALLYTFWILSSFFLASPVTSYLGCKRAMLLGVIMADIFYFAFAFAAALDDGTLKTFLVIGGNCLSGLGAGLFWTAQGAYYARSCELLAEATGGKLEDQTNSMSAIFAAWNFIAEVVLKLMASGIDFFEVAQWLSMGIACAASVVMTVYMATQTETLPEGKLKLEPQRKSLISAMSLWRDPALWLLSFMNLTFGFSGALLNGKINGAYVRPQLGLYSIGLLTALLSFVALAVQRPYEQLVKAFGKVSIMWLGTLSFFALAICARFLDLSSLGYGLVIFFILQATGRAAYESTNRAIIADFWPPPQSEDAFANESLQQGGAFTAAFLLQIRFDIREMADTQIVLCLLIMPGVYAAYRVRAAIQEKASKESEVELF